ncbi:MAG: hypothetical protein RLZZ30_333 [Bacteroidota bacterium]|jgi:hypothetical protein
MRSIYALLTVVCMALSVVSCGGPAKKDQKTELKTSIKQMEDSIMAIQKDPMQAAKMPSLTNIELINRLLAYYHAFPKDKYASECLFKVHIKYSDLQAYELSVAYGDTLLQQFPNFENKDFLLESIASTYDVLIEPREMDKVKFYYELLLKENLKPSKRKDIENRLAHIDMDFFTYSQFRMTGK